MALRGRQGMQCKLCNLQVALGLKNLQAAPPGPPERRRRLDCPLTSCSQVQRCGGPMLYSQRKGAASAGAGFNCFGSAPLQIWLFASRPAMLPPPLLMLLLLH